MLSAERITMLEWRALFLAHQIIAMAYDWTFQGRSEMVRCSLDTLAICSIMPKVQLSFCEKIKLYDETNVGVHILLSAAEGEIVQVSIQ